MAVALVQNTSNFLSSGNTTLAQAFGSNNTAGNLLVCVGGIYPTTNTQGISDTQGNGWVSVFSAATTFNLRYQVWIAANCKAGANTVTTQNNGVSQAYMTMQIAEFSGFTASASIDQTSSNSGSASGDMDSGSKTTVQNGELVLGYGSSANSVQDPGGEGAGFTKLAFSDGDEFEYLVQTSAGSISATMLANSGTTDWFLLMVTVATSGLNLSVSVSDSTAATTESVTVRKVVKPSVSDATSATGESVTAVLLADPNVSDSAAMSEAVIEAVGTAQSVSDSATTAESITGLVVRITSVSDATSATAEGITAATVNALVVSDSAATAESIAAASLTEALAVSEAVTASELFSAILLTSGVVSDSASASENVALAAAGVFPLSVSDFVTGSESVTAAETLNGPTVSDSTAASESSVLSIRDFLSVADSAGVAETVVGVQILDFAASDSAAVSESVTISSASANVAFAAVFESLTQSESVGIVSGAGQATSAPETIFVTESAVPAIFVFVTVADAASVAELVDPTRISPGEAVDRAAVDENVSLLIGSEAFAVDNVTVTEGLAASGPLERLVFVLDTAVSDDFVIASRIRFDKYIWIQGNGIGDGQTEPEAWLQGDGLAGYNS